MKHLVEWQRRTFAELSVPALYAALQLRSEVFVVEQHCVFQDIDGADAEALHLLGYHDGVLVAYARCFPAGIKFAEASIGRVVTRTQVRGKGLGHALVQEAILSVCTLWGRQPIRIGAQSHLRDFYSTYGFSEVGKAYIEDGIQHLEMLWQP